MSLRHHDPSRRKRPSGTAGWLLAELAPHAAELSLAVVLLCASSGLLALGPYLVRHAIDVDIAGRDAAGLARTVLLYLGVEVLNLGLIYGLRLWLERIGQAILATLKKRLFAHVIALPLSFHDRQSPGKLLSRIQNDTQALRALFSSSAVTILGDVLMMAIVLVVMLAVSPRLTLVALSVLPTVLLFSTFFHRKTHPIFLSMRGLTAEVTAALTEMLSGSAVIRAYERRRWAAARLQEKNERKLATQLKGERLFVLWFHGMTWLQTLAMAAILGLGGVWTLAGSVTIGTLTMFLGYVRRLFAPLFHISEQLAEVQRAWSAAERIREILAVPLPETASARGAWPGLSRSVCFENVWFRYHASVEDEGWVLKDVSFTLPAGERWALVGPTGSGKTTVVSLLSGFYQPERGRILVDGVDLRSIDPAEVTGHVGLVLQDIHLFAGDLTDNLTLGASVSRETLERAARVTQAERIVAKLPGGWHADIAELGANLSHGERQLLSFARALVKDPPLLVLDEATSAIDPATESLVAQALEQLLRGRTALIVAHRLSTIRSADRILVMDRGRIVEEGTHDALSQGAGLYEDLHSRQKEAAHAIVV